MGSRWTLASCVVPALSVLPAAPAAEESAALAAMVRADWEAQEARLGREPQSVEAIQAALQRTAQLLNDLAALPSQLDLSAEAGELQRLTLRHAMGCDARRDSCRSLFPDPNPDPATRAEESAGRFASHRIHAA